jgi:hypothetical protein
MKRLIIATILGVLSGFVCYSLASGEQEIPVLMAISMIISRALIGFGIGVSRFKMQHWTIHGLVMGLVFSLPGGFAVMAGPENPEFSANVMFFLTVGMGMFYGLMIELITSVVFKAKQ